VPFLAGTPAKSGYAKVARKVVENKGFLGFVLQKKAIPFFPN